jgi:hypothetical protein
MSKSIYITFTGMLFVVVTANAAEQLVTKVVPDAERNQTLVILSDGLNVVVPLVRIEPIAVLKTPSGKPRLLLSGATCTECDMNQSIYLLPLDLKTGEPPRYSYPGTLKAYDTGELVEKSRMFFGQCLSEANAVVWFGEYLGEDNKWHKSDSILWVKDSEAVLSNLSSSEGNLNTVLLRIKRGVCTELPGVDGNTEP